MDTNQPLACRRKADSFAPCPGDEAIIQILDHNCKHECNGGAGGTQTPYLRNANAALYQMSYGPKNSTIIAAYEGSGSLSSV